MEPVLGIPAVLDRFIQQAVLQVLQKHWDRTFSERSYGFRPRRSAHKAVAQAQRYIGEGRRWVVDIDLEKFFDGVNHDRLMGRLAQRLRDKAALKLIRAFLNAGVMERGLVSPVTEGTPQGGRCRHSCPTSCWTNWTGSWSDEATALCVTRTTVTSTSAVNGRGNG